MIYVLTLLVAWAVFSIYYIHKLKMQIHSHEAGWNQIEEISDHNQDGDVVIHIQHVPETKTTPTELVTTKPTNQDRDSW